MKHVLWILAWAIVPIIVSDNNINEDSQVTSEDSKESIDEKDRSKRQLNFDGGGGGVNRYVNGDDGDYEYYDTRSTEYWADDGKVRIVNVKY